MRRPQESRSPGGSLYTGPDEAQDLLAVAKKVAARHAELNLLRRSFDPDHELILTLSRGRFQAELFEYVQVLSNGKTQWPTYSAALYADGKVLWSPDSRWMCENMLDQLNEGGRNWLSSYLVACDLMPAGENDLLDFQEILVKCDLRYRALWDRGQHRWYEENKDRFGRTGQQIGPPPRKVDFRVEEMGEESWRITPLTEAAREYIRRPGVEHGSWQPEGEGFLLDRAGIALKLMQELASCDYRLENHWLDPLREPVRDRDGPATEPVLIPGPCSEDADTLAAHIRERAETFETILARYTDTKDHGRLVSLLADARYWAHDREVDFDRCLQLSKDLNKDEVKVAKSPETGIAATAAGAEWLRDNADTQTPGGEPMSEKPQHDNTRKPEAKLACGDVRGSIWLNQSARGEYFTLSIATVYRAPDGTKQMTHSFTTKDLSDLIELAEGARKFIHEESLKRGLGQQAEVQRLKITR
jgi:hypothetical protein